MSEDAAIRKIAEAAAQASESAMVNPHRIIQLLDTIESTESQLSQALRERDAAIQSRDKSNSTLGGLIGNVLDPLKSERDQALRELGEAREELGRPPRSTRTIIRLTDERDHWKDAALGFQAELKDVRQERDAALRSTAELRGALEEARNALINANGGGESRFPMFDAALKRIRTALASSSTKET